MFGYVYLMYCIPTKKWYVGQKSSLSIVENYVGSNTEIIADKKEYGVTAFNRWILEWCETREKLSISETKWISVFAAVCNKSFYNRSPGGGKPTKGFKHSDETKLEMKRRKSDPDLKLKFSTNLKATLNAPGMHEKLSAAQTKSYSRPELREKLSASLKAALALPEARARKKIAMKDAQGRPEVNAKRSASLKKTLSENPDLCAQRSDRLLKEWQDPDMRAKKCAAMSAINSTPEMREKRSLALKEYWKRKKEAKLSIISDNF